MSRLSTLTLTAFLSLSSSAFSNAEDIGLATGYPPYQFAENGELTGFDVDVTKAVFNYLNKEYTLHQHDWDNVVSLLRFGELDMAMGMEQTTIRQQYFDFSSPYYNRVTTLFVLDNESSPESVRGLVGKRISGDRHSVLEAHLQDIGLDNAIRINQASSKAEAMNQLAMGEVEAVIMPEAVGRYLAKQLDINVRVLWQPDINVPVGFAVKAGSDELLNQLNKALEALENNGELDQIRRRWDVN
ncbi:transporter substrate-binding domain-containing protein [Idiomarina zobellii]|jgi:ABC-type amino acid transport substrate-binding protein|uniref:Solute-binding protein family 3/N-terminal domain-containing protein n=1 Tax=Idiomarina zobellii TaxID=86103 RepID=A0A837NEX9_9GAMM|nr:transporter substrate-binding domain-containing protein [Idiomarina zobellii]KPD22054.1 hypothetical protein AFK76_11460 [Idiomarina zobellii]SDG24577.1 amino acid ABC transporter substrate-binding protein, PAAT family [Idiomarina zobellii]